MVVVVVVVVPEVEGGSFSVEGTVPKGGRGASSLAFHSLLAFQFLEQ